MKITKLSKKQLLLEFPTRKEMNLTFFRISEFSEGFPELQKYYTPDIFIDLWSDDKGDLNYWSYWEGYNISKQKLNEFYIAFDQYFNVSNREFEVIQASKDIDEDGHVIAMEEGDEMTFKHEMAHSYYFLYPDYKLRADSIVNSLTEDIRGRFKKGLIDMKYTEEVLQDETIAYITAFDDEEFRECFSDIKLSEILDQQILLNNLYHEFKDKYNLLNELG